MNLREIFKKIRTSPILRARKELRGNNIRETIRSEARREISDQLGGNPKSFPARPSRFTLMPPSGMKNPQLIFKKIAEEVHKELQQGAK